MYPLHLALNLEYLLTGESGHHLLTIMAEWVLCTEIFTLFNHFHLAMETSDEMMTSGAFYAKQWSHGLEDDS